MLQGYVSDQIRRHTRNLLITNVIIALIVLAIPLLAMGYLRECLGGPYPMTLEQIASSVQSDHTFVRVHIDRTDLDDTAYHIHGGNEHKDDYYHFLHLPNGHYLIIKAYSMNLSDEIVGSLKEVSGDAANKVIPAVQRDMQGQALPRMIDLASYRSGMWVYLGICMPLLLLAVWNISKAFGRMGNPLKHPSARQLALLGPPEEIAVAVDAEVREGGSRVGKVLATRSWLIRPSAFSTDFLYLGDIAWAYKHETVHKSYGVTTGRTYATIIFDVRGKRWSFDLTQAQVDGLLKELIARVPWAIIGFNAQMQAAWQKNRNQVLAAIAERKKQTESGSAEKEPPEPPAQ